MWLFRSTHKHISQDTLSEYLDGRLQGRPLERVEQQLEQCDACRQDLTDLQSVVTMMRQLPMETPRRSFVMSAPPLDFPETTPSFSNPFLRVPSWVYAGAASFAALALVVTISLDASGSLDSDSFGGDAAISARVPEAAIEQLSGAQTGTGGGLEMESAARSADTAAATGESSGTDRDEEALPEMAAAAAAPVAEGEPSEGVTFAFGAEAAAAPTSAPNEEPAPRSGAVSTAKTTDTDSESADGDAAPESVGVRGPQSMPGNAGLSLTVIEANEIADNGISDDADEDTSVWWRVLEVTVGVLAVLLFAGLVLRWRAVRRYSI